VQIITPEHARQASRRREGGWESGKPVRIGRSCWIGSGAIILPGVTLGDDVIVGAGAVVTKSLGDGVTIAGVPARIIKEKRGEEEETEAN